jgi:hypothetical protein
VARGDSGRRSIRETRCHLEGAARIRSKLKDYGLCIFKEGCPCLAQVMNHNPCWVTEIIRIHLFFDNQLLLGCVLLLYVAAVLHLYLKVNSTRLKLVDGDKNTRLIVLESDD